MIDSRLWPMIASRPTTSTPVSSGPRWCRLSSASAMACRYASASPRELMKVSSPHMAKRIVPRRAAPAVRISYRQPVRPDRAKFEGMAEQGTKTEAHDPDHPEKLLEFMRTGWRHIEPDTAALPQAPHYAKRRAALA